eukprot:CAMPEP_0172815396 /NCGR_PEP_ID=MMETSP1075-20121228/11735_1 /TAXON_ID=2916 /ORGANISM="Ceratium fusus, Strain PA161109" /LENGTH=281 /DNA_ID=CAMNT_0013655233 /DNA_START=64 /DNA_END=908 /DNA_ORIENTATION=-
MANPCERVYVTSLPGDTNEERLKEIFGAYGTLKGCKHIPSAKSCLLTFASLEEAKWVVENLDGNMPEGITEPIKAQYAAAPASSAYGKAPVAPVSFGGGWNTGRDRVSPYADRQASATAIMNQLVAAAKGGGRGGGGSIQMLKAGMLPTLPGGISGRGSRPNDCQLLVKGLPPDTTDADLLEIFSPFGAIPPKGVKAMLTHDGMCTGVGWVDFNDAATAQTAINTLHGTQLVDGSLLRINVKQARSWGAPSPSPPTQNGGAAASGLGHKDMKASKMPTVVK